MPRSVHTDEYQRLIGLLVAVRKAAGITQTELAASLAKPQSYVSKIENSERRLDVVEFCDWVTALGRQPDALLAEFLIS